MSKTTTMNVEIRFGDCDPAGIVFFPRYHRWMDAASLNFFMSCGVPPWHVLEHSTSIIGTSLLEHHARFVKSATYGERLHITSEIVEWRPKVFEHLGLTKNLPYPVQIRGDLKVNNGMKLIANLSMLGPKPTGLGVYSGHCSQALASRFTASFIAGQSPCPPGEVLVKAPESVAIGGGKLAAIRRQLWMRSLSFDAGSLVYSPTHHGLPGVRDQIITIHDLICLRFPSQHKPQYLFFKFGLPRLLKKCRAVFCVSETSRQDVAQTYGYPADRIYVVPNGVDTTSFSANPAAREGDPYLLMVGARYSHKNVDEVLAMSEMWSPKFRLLVTSCPGGYREHLEQLVASRAKTPMAFQAFHIKVKPNTKNVKKAPQKSSIRNSEKLFAE